MKRIWSLLVVLMMLIPASGLAAINETGYPISDEVITLTAAGQNTGTLDWNDTVMVQEFEKRLGIKLDCQQFEGDVWKTQFTLMLADDSLPDIIINPGITLAEIADYGSQGYFLDLKPYLEQYAPNIMAYAEQYPTYMPYNTAPDGGVYTLNQINPNLVGQISRVWLNKVWMDNLGLEYPETIEDLTNVLRAFKEQDANGNGDPNDEIPLSHLGGYTAWHNLMTAFGIFHYNGSDKPYSMQLDENGKVYLAETTENYKAFLTWMNQLWDEGLLDIDQFVQTTDEFRAKAAADKVGMFGDAAPFVARNNDISQDGDFYWIGGLTSEWNTTPTIVKSSAISGTGEIVINASTEHPEACVRFLDYFFTEEGNLAGSYGFEGSCWNYITFPVEGMEEYTVTEMMNPNGEWASHEEFRYKKAIINEAFNIVKAWAGTQYPVLLSANDEQLEAALPAYGWAVRLIQKGINRCEILDTFPALLYTADETTERTQLYTDLTLYLENMRAQFVTGQTDIEAGWDEYINQLNAMGYERLMEIEQAAYDRLMGA